MKKIEIVSFDNEGYEKVISYKTWRVAMLNYIDELEVEEIDNVQAHNETDESFVLLRGSCILYVCDVVDGEVKDVEAIDMKPYTVYNIKKGVYHTHTLNKKGKVLIVENDDTSDENSVKIMIDQTLQNRLIHLRDVLWD